MNYATKLGLALAVLLSIALGAISIKRMLDTPPSFADASCTYYIMHTSLPSAWGFECVDGGFAPLRTLVGKRITLEISE